MKLVPITADDLPLYQLMHGDPRMMTELGGVHPPENIPGIHKRALGFAESGTAWVMKVLPDDDSNRAAGIVTIWDSSHRDESLSEIGWMILPEFQGRGLASAAVGAMLERERLEKRWGVIHAFPGVTNGPSNAICRKAGFTLIGETDLEYAGRPLHVNHWRLGPLLSQS